MGYDGVEIRMIEGQTDLPGRPEFAPAAINQSLRMFQDQGVAICGLASSVRFDHAEPAQYAADLRSGVDYLRLAARLRAGFVRVFGDVLPEAGNPRRRADVLGQIARGLEELGRAAEREAPEVRVVLETHGDFSASPAVAELLRCVQAPQAAILWDTHHPWRFHAEDPAETWRLIGARVFHTHWKDSVLAAGQPLSAEQLAAQHEARRLMSGHRHADYVLFGEGEFPARACLSLLRRAGYQGWLTYEWEKAWHPEIADPEVALPPFPGIMRRLWRAA
jgi:sugar phosphate isomerase/epimerase